MKYLIFQNELTSLDKQFIRMMKDKDLWVKYASNIQKQRNIPFYKHFKNERNVLNGMANYIMFGFRWASTDEGTRLWQDLYCTLSRI